MFDKLESRLEIAGWLTAETAFRIGAGRSTEVLGTDLPVVRDAHGKPYIPGSSFKGVLRSRLESLVRALGDGRRFACIPTEETEWCVTTEEAGRLKEESRKRDASDRDRALTQEIMKKSCLLCRTFGSPWLASKVLLRDLLVDEKLWAGQFQVRDGVAIDRDTETADDGKLYDYEVIPSGSRFGLRVLLENGEKWQWGMLFLGLKAFQDAAVPLGGGKSRGLGWVKLQLDQRRLFSLDGEEGDARVEKLFAFLNGQGFVDVTDVMVHDWVQAFRDNLTDMMRQREGG